MHAYEIHTHEVYLIGVYLMGVYLMGMYLKAGSTLSAQFSGRNQALRASLTSGVRWLAKGGRCIAVPAQVLGRSSAIGQALLVLRSMIRALVDIILPIVVFGT